MRPGEGNSVVPFANTVTCGSPGGTLIGDPPNILMGPHADLSFNQFALNLAPAALLSLVVTAGAVWVIFRRSSACICVRCFALRVNIR